MKKASENRRKKSIWKYLVFDILAAGIIFGVFYLFLEIIPQYQQYQKLKEAMAQEQSVADETPTPEATPTPTPEATPTPTPEATPMPTPEATPTPTPEATPMPTPEATPTPTPEVTPTPTPEETLREKFADYFTEEVIVEKYSYSSPNISIQITKDTDKDHGSMDFKYYIADIHVVSMDNFQTGFPTGHRIATTEQVVKDNKAILGINGDYYLNINKGLLVRNGVVLQDDEGTSDICVIYKDGRMETFGPGEYDLEKLLSEEPYQVWSFGPMLLDHDSAPMTEFNTTPNIATKNPRTAIGYYEPGHYCFVVIDGRMMGNSYGASMRALSAFMADLGCKVAYNLDGGASSCMVFNGKIINKPSGGGRKISDIVFLRELPDSPITIEKNKG